MRHQILCAAAGLMMACAVGLGQNPASRPQVPARPAPAATANFMQGQIVNVNPQAGMMTLRTGTGAAVREQQFRMANNAKFFGADRRMLSDGLSFNGFRPGTSVFFQAGTGNLATTIHDLRLFNPALPALTGEVLRGEIVSVDVTTGMITIRTGTGANAVVRKFRVTEKTLFFGPDLLALNNGLAFNGFAAGAPVWFVPGASGTVSGLSLANPAVQTEPAPTTAGTEPKQPMPPAATPAPSKYVTGKIVALDPEERTITVKTGAGDSAREQTFKVFSDAQFFGPDQEPIQEGLKFSGLRPGVDVWMRVGTEELANTVRELRMADPTKKQDK